jgi:hypothetical protein
VLVGQGLALSGPVAVMVGKAAIDTWIAEPLLLTRMVPPVAVGKVAGAAALSVGTWPDGTVSGKLSTSPASVPVLTLAQIVFTLSTEPADMTVTLFQPVEPSFTGLATWPPMPWNSHRLPLLATPIRLGIPESLVMPGPDAAPDQASPVATTWLNPLQPLVG